MKAPFLFLASAVSLLSQDLEKVDAGSFEKLTMDELYSQLCANCHGADLSGGLGPSFLDAEWKHGSSTEAITRNIAKGNPDFGMVAFEQVLSDEKIRGLVIYLQEKNANALAKGVTYPRPTPGEVIKTERHNYLIETVIDDEAALQIPWAIGFLPDGSMLVTERPGGVRLRSPEGDLTAVENLPEVLSHGQGGMMEVAVHPNYAENGWIYLGYTNGFEENGDKLTMTRYVRGRLQGNKWIDEELIWECGKEFYTKATVHFGTRLVFTDDGKIMFPIGERAGMMKSQEPDQPTGKTFRLSEDGSIPDDNPSFPGNAVPGLYTVGHRNPQGFAKHPVTGEIWSTEHGPRGGDELNHIQGGLNYGWSDTSYGMNYNGTPMKGTVTERDGITNPVHYWVPSIAVCGLEFYAGEEFPEWRNDLFVGGLRDQSVTRMRLDGNEVIEQEIVLKDIGRVRDVAYNPHDGYLYVVLNSPNTVVRLVPAKN